MIGRDLKRERAGHEERKKGEKRKGEVGEGKKGEE